MAESIQAENIGIRYDDNDVLHGINEYIAPGETITIIGPSGSGKSTLLKVLAGLEEPDEGTVWYGSSNYYKAEEAAQLDLQFHTGFVFQEAALMANMTVRDNIALPLVYHNKFPEHEITERVEATLSEFNLERWKNLRPAQLSIGKKKLVALARALIMEPDILFLDDPTANTDATSAAQLKSILIRRKREEAFTTVIVSSDIKLAKTVSDRLLIMYNGEIIAKGTVRTVLAHKNRIVQQIIKSVAIHDDIMDAPARKIQEAET